MSMDMFMNDLNGGFAGAAGGAAAAAPSGNPWVIGGAAVVGGALGAFNAHDKNKSRAMRINNRLGDQEAAMGDLNLEEAQAKRALEMKKRRAWEQFGGMFSNYIAGMAKPTGAIDAL